MAKKKDEIKSKDIAEIMAKLNKDYGSNSVISFNEEKIDEYDVIPCGSIGIDYKILGVGGFVKGRVYMIKGWNGSNKSTLCAHISANCQKSGGTVVYIDSERAVDKLYFSQLSVVFDHSFILCQPDFGDAGYEMALQLMESGKVDLVIFDSDSALLPKAMMEGEVGTATIGKKAKLNSETYPKIKVSAAKNNVCVISVAQYRINPGLMFGDNRVVPGGFALEYVADCILELTKRLKKEGEETSGTNTTFKTSKNKMYVPYKSYEVSTIFGYGFDKIEEIMDLANEYDIIHKWGNSIHYEGVKYTISNFKELLLEESFYKNLKTTIIEAIKNEKNTNKKDKSETTGEEQGEEIIEAEDVSNISGDMG